MPVEWVNYRTRIISFRGARGGGARGGGARPISGAEERGHADEADRTPRCARAADVAGELSRVAGHYEEERQILGGLWGARGVGEVGEVGSRWGKDTRKGGGGHCIRRAGGLS